MRGYDIYVLVASFCLALIFHLNELHKWKRFLEGRCSAIDLSVTPVLLFGGFWLAWIPVHLVYCAWIGVVGDLDGATFLAGPEFFVWVVLLILPAGFLGRKITTRMRPSLEKLKEMKQANDLADALIKMF